MSDNGESFVFYKSFLDAIELLPEGEQLKAFKLIAHYGANGELPEGEQTLANAIFLMAKPNIDATKEKRSNGKKGGRPAKETEKNAEKEIEKPVVSENENHSYEDEKTMVSENENHRLSKPESNVDVNVNVDGNVDVNVNVNDDVNVNGDEESKKGAKQSSRFTPPTREEAAAYVKEQGLTRVDLDKFFDYYASNGWKVGKNSMKDWKATLRNWNRNEVNTVRPSPSGVTQKFKPEGRDLSFLEV